MKLSTLLIVVFFYGNIYALDNEYNNYSSKKKSS